MKVGVPSDTPPSPNVNANAAHIDPIGTKYGKGYHRKFITDLPIGQDDCYYFDELRVNQVIAVHYMVSECDLSGLRSHQRP